VIGTKKAGFNLAVDRYLA